MASTPRPGSDAGEPSPGPGASGRPSVDDPQGFLSPIRPRPRTDPTFARSIGATVAGALLPGLGLMLGRRKLFGTLLFAATLALVHLLIFAVAFERQSLLALALNPAVMRFAGVGLVLVAAVWIGSVVLTHLRMRPTRPTTAQRGIGAVVVGLLSFAIAAPLAVGSVYATTSAESVGRVFKSQADQRSATRPSTMPTTGDDPWAGIDRVNILLLGGDSDNGKREGVRTDTVIVASIDPKTGATTLISLPRNTARMPFPTKAKKLFREYPNGWTSGDGDDPNFMLNAMYEFVPAEFGEDVVGETDNVGADVLKLSVGAALGLDIDYFVLIDIQGFSKMIDALGGVTVNVNSRIAMGGSVDRGIPPPSWLEPGPEQHLNGTEAMWFARGRYGDNNGDFDRMDRQRCVIDAMIRQASPANVVQRYEAIAREGGQLILTDIPQEALPGFVDLSTRVKGGAVRSLVFKNGVAGFSSGRPDYDLVRQQVKTAIGATKRTEPPSGAPTPSPTTKPSSTPDDEESESESSSTRKGSSSSTRKSSSSSRAEDASVNTADACAFSPV